MTSSYLPATFGFALLSTQNPPFVLASGTCAWLFARDTRVQRDAISWHRSFPWMCLSVVTALLAPAYYWVRLGALSGAQLAQTVSCGPVSVKRMGLWLFDPEIGLLPNWPFGLALLLISILLAPRRARRDSRFTVFAILYVLAMAFAQSRTTNINHGMVVYVSRYGTWYLCLFLPLAVRVATWMCSPERPLARRLALVVLLEGFLFTQVIWFPSRPETYLSSSLPASLLYRYAPNLYDPEPVIFIERHWGLGKMTQENIEALARDGMLITVGNPSCTKILFWRPSSGRPAVVPRGAPLGCDPGAQLQDVYDSAGRYFAQHPDAMWTYAAKPKSR
jgi:hypothetical protein